MDEPGVKLPTEWAVLNSESDLHHPFATIALEHVVYPHEIIPERGEILTPDFANVVVINEARQAMILEGYKAGSDRLAWHIMGEFIQAGEDPLTGVQRRLLEISGLATDDWSYLGSFVTFANSRQGAGHFFCAQMAKMVKEPNLEALADLAVKWISLKELRYALLDGRLAALNYATAVSLSLLTVLK